MHTQRPRSCSELMEVAGKLPRVAAVLTLTAALTAAPLLAQAPVPAGDAEQPKVRDPMRPEKGEGDKPKVVVGEHLTVDLHVKDEDLSNVLQLLSIQTQKNIIASKNVSAKVTATLYGVTFYQALDAILHVNGFGYLEQGNFIYVYTQEELKQIEAALKKRVAKVIRLNYLNANDAKEFATPLLSKDGGEIKTNVATANFGIPEKSPTGKDDYALTATMVVIDFEENITAIEDLIRQLDTKPSQVLVESTILQTALNEANAFGVDFAVIGDLNFSDFLNIGGPLGAANGLIRGGSGAAGQGLSPSDNQGTAVVSNPGNTSGPGTFKLGVVGGDVSVFVRMLDQVTDTVILSNPKILALNRQPARVLVGKRVGYLNTTSTETSTTQTVEFLDTGTQLYFRPFVSAEGDIRMELKPQVSAAEIRTVTDANGAAVTIPDEVTQELVTNVNVKDGQTIVLGGLFTESTTFNRRQVPWLGDLPIVGAAFRGNDDNTQRTEIIFLVTPSIVNDTSLAAAAETATENVDRVRAGARQGLLPWSRDKMTAQLNLAAEHAARDGKHEEALHKIQRSLGLNPYQPSVYELRERITSEKENWPTGSQLESIFSKEIRESMEQVQPAPAPVPHTKPKGSVTIPREPVSLKNSDDGTMRTASNRNTRTSGSTGSTTSAAGFTSGRQLGQSFQEIPSGETFSGSGTFAPVKPSLAVRLVPAGDGSTGSVDPAAINMTLAQLETLRGQLERYSTSNGINPELGRGGSDGWEALTSAGIRNESPSNTYVGGPNARKVVVGNGPDTAFHSDYGWIYDPQSGQLWAAGFDAQGSPLQHSGAGFSGSNRVAAMDDGSARWDKPIMPGNGDQPTAQDIAAYSNWLAEWSPELAEEFKKAMAAQQRVSNGTTFTSVPTDADSQK